MGKYHKQDVAPIEKENERDENYEASNPIEKRRGITPRLTLNLEPLSKIPYGNCGKEIHSLSAGFINDERLFLSGWSIAPKMLSLMAGTSFCSDFMVSLINCLCVCLSAGQGL